MKIVYPEEIMTAKIKQLEKENEELKAENERLKNQIDLLDFDFMESVWRN
jgi:cell division protein FtsB